MKDITIVSCFCSKIFKPIIATENFVKTHSQIFKYIGLGILGAGRKWKSCHCSNVTVYL